MNASTTSTHRWKFCPFCGKELSPGARFCTACGETLAPAAPTAGGGGGTGAAASGNRTLPGRGATGSGPAPGPERGGRVAWGFAGLLLVALILLIAFPVLNPTAPGENDPASAAPGMAPLGAAPGIDLSSMSPREAADRLFQRVMNAVGQGDSTQVFNFVPMALAAYERAEPLEADGLFRLSLLEAVALDFVSARETAESGLEDHPGHLLLLSAAAAAANAMGDTAVTRRHYREVVDGYDRELAKGLPEYETHAGLLPLIRGEAERFLDGIPER